MKHCARKSRVGATAAIFAALATPALALKADPDEKDRLEACERVLCETVVKKAPKTGAIACDLSKTWQRTKIKKGASSKSLSWGYGDAKCKLDVSLPRKHVVTALKAKKHKFFLPRHTVNCRVETKDGIKPVRVVLRPKLKFKGGKVRKVYLKVKKIEAPAFLKSLIWSTVKLEDTLGIFQSEMVDEINEFLHRKCPKRHG